MDVMPKSFKSCSDNARMSSRSSRSLDSKRRMISLDIPMELNHKRTVQSPTFKGIGEEVEGELGEARGGVEAICEDEDEVGAPNVN